MRRRVINILLSMCLTLSLAACGNATVESEKEVVTENAVKTEEDSQSEVAVSENASEPAEQNDDESTVGTVVNENGISKIPVVTDKELNSTGSAGPINYSIDAIQISKLTATTDDMASMLDIEKDKEAALVVVDVTVENTSEDDITFYMDQAVLVSSTKEQVEPNMWLSDYLGGDFLGQVVKSGSLMYILPNSSAEDITAVTLRASAPIDADWNSLSEDISIELSFE